MNCPKCRANMHHSLENKETTAWSCPTCGKWVETPKVVMAMNWDTMSPQWSGNRFKMKPCPVEGCKNEMRYNSDAPYCRRCNSQMREWVKGKMTTPAPIQMVDGRLVKRKRVREELAA